MPVSFVGGYRRVAGGEGFQSGLAVLISEHADSFWTSNVVQVFVRTPRNSLSRVAQHRSYALIGYHQKKCLVISAMSI